VEFAPADESDLDAWCRAAMGAPVLAPDEETQLAYWIEAGDPASRDHLVRANLRLVVEAARRHAGEGAMLLRHLQAGTHGLLLAVEGFDPTSGERFAEHASGWIEQAIQQARPG
jgi:RNA polymerase primary sigma factor